MSLHISEQLKQLRISRHFSQGQVATAIGVSPSAISAYENNIRQPSCDILIKFAQLYRVSTDYILGHTSDQMLDISDLNAYDAAIISQLVSSMSGKGGLNEGRKVKEPTYYTQI